MTATPEGRPAGFDIAIFDLAEEADASVPMELLAPRSDPKRSMSMGQPLGITFHVLGDESATFRASVRKTMDEVNGALYAEPQDPGAQDILGKARLAACALTGWDGVVFEGQPVRFSRAEAIKLFVARPWAARQVESFRNNPENFCPRD